MEFMLKKISDYGTENPIVARTSVQVSNLLQPFSIPKPQKERIIEIFFSMFQPRLIRCLEVVNRISSKIDKFNAEIQENGIKTQSDGRILDLPHITQLQEDVETYLHNAKSALRDLALLFEPFFNEKFDYSEYQQISEWATAKFGQDALLPTLLKSDQEWIKYVVNHQNAIEHPGGHAGRLYVENYQVAQSQESGAHQIIPPTWHLNNDNPTLLLPDLEVILSNLLEFSEYLLVACLKQYGSPFPIIFYQIPEEERDSSAPVRLAVTMDFGHGSRHQAEG